MTLEKRVKVRLCNIDDVQEGTMLQVAVPDQAPFTVYRVEGQFHVTDDTCTHGKASLADEGDLDGHCVTCTWHDGKFDIRTGAALSAPCSVPLRVYRVSVEGDSVSIELD